MAKSEIGTIIAVIKEGRPQYRVRLEYGQIVLVEAGQVTPARLTLLGVGARLRVTHDLGRVESASTELALEVNGRVKAVLHQAQGTSYRLQMDQGDPVVIQHSQVAPRPAYDLLEGAVLVVTLESGVVKAARLVLERLTCQVLNLERSKNVVRVRTQRGEAYNVRLNPAAILAGQFTPGEALAMEIEYTPDGARRIILQPPARKEPASPSAPVKPGRSARETSTKPAHQAEPQRAAETEIVGLDPVYFEQRKREGHRFEIMSFLEEHRRDGLVEWYRLKPGQEAEYSHPEQPLPPALEKAVAASVDHFKGFFNHQAQALDAIRRDRNLVMVTPTASGKTLGYNPGIFEYLISHPNSHALYLFPLNALMTDQKEKIDQLVAALVAQGIRLSAEMLLGGMSDQRAGMARSSPNILATNPEMLGVILNEAGQWQSFFSGLKYIVVDEVHSYRGIFGLHMAGLVRRLLITARRFGAEPRVLISSATVSNPLDLAVRLTSLPSESFELLQADGSAQASKHWTVLNPDWGSASSRYDNYLSVAASVFVELITRKNARGQASPLNTLLFCRSIRDVNRAAKQIRDQLARHHPGLAGKVKSYVSASLSTLEKREIYDSLRSGSLVGVVSTNALEAGIDIGRLDAGIIAGFPFSVMAMRQMAGRIGRQNEGLVCFVPHPLSSLDQYYRETPEHLLSQPPEVFVIDPQNPYIARKHINAVANALGGLAPGDLEAGWGERGPEIARQAALDGAMRLKGGRWLGTRRNFNNPDDVYAIQNIRSNAQRPYAVCLDDGQPCNFANGACLNPSRKTCPRQVATLDREYIYRDCHPGAIYEATNGKLYRVTRFDDRQRVARVQELPDATLERTYVEEDTSIATGDQPRARRSLAPGIDLAWGDVTVTRLFTGYYRYSLIPSRRCRYCHREYDGDTPVCPICRRPAEVFFNRSRPERLDFPEEHQLGFQIVLKTSACWLTVRPEIETRLESASPCKLPGDQNKVLRWLKKPQALDSLPKALKVSPEEKDRIQDYYNRASKALQERPAGPQEALLFPGLYGQCLLAHLRAGLPESRALELFQAVTGYPVTEDLRHVCRKCQTSSLYPAMHTLEHSVVTRYPSVALGDPSDLGTFTTLGHSQTGLPSVFWFDDYEGGLGAAEKVYDHFNRLLEIGVETIQDCACTTLEGCPRCTYLGSCAEGNAELSKAAGIALACLISGKPPAAAGLQAFLYRKKRAGDFDKSYEKNEYSAAAHGVGEEAPGPAPASTPNVLLRVQPQVHRPVLQKAFEVRSQEISEEVPPLSASELNEAYNQAQRAALGEEWQLNPGLTPYQVLEVLPSASNRMVQQVYRVIALQVHPDRNPGKAAWANEMMKILNDAYDRIIKEKK